jgi:hypothetical protein
MNCRPAEPGAVRPTWKGRGALDWSTKIICQSSHMVFDVSLKTCIESLRTWLRNREER